MFYRISVESLESQTTGRTDERDEKDGGYLDIDDDSLLADFKMPDLSVSMKKTELNLWQIKCGQP